MGTGSPVLVVHGAGSHGPIWADDLEPLTDTHRLIVPTRRGYPGSPPSPRDWSAHAEDMMSVLDSAGVESADVVGHGAGCIVVVDLALRHAERVKRLVLLDPALRLRELQRASFRRVCLKMKLLRLVSERQAIETWFRYVLSYQPNPPSARSREKSAWTEMPEGRRDARWQSLRIHRPRCRPGGDLRCRS